MDLKSKFQIQNVAAYILQILQYLIFYICLDHFHIFWVLFYLLSFTSLVTRHFLKFKMFDSI